MIRGTTPDYLLDIEACDLTDKAVTVTIDQNNIRITKARDELSISSDESGSTIAFMLSQRDTLRLKEGTADIQVRFIDSTGRADATHVASIPVDRVLSEGVITYDTNSANG